MNALGVKDEAHLERLFDDPNYVADEKMDGMRAVVHLTKSGLRIFSRSAGVNDPTRPLEKTDVLPHLASLQFPFLAGTVLDCEILVPGKDSAITAGTVHRKHTNGDSRQVKIFVFDVIFYRDVDLSDMKLYTRMGYLVKVESEINSRYIEFLPVAFSPAEKRKLYQSVLKQGGEGVMFKNLYAKYVQGGRPVNNWFKAKKSATFDCILMGFTNGAGKYNNRIGAVEFGQFVNGNLTKLGRASGMTDEVREDMSLHPEKYIGKVITIRGMERLKSGKIRHPQFGGIREDKKPKDCVWYKSEQ